MCQAGTTQITEHKTTVVGAWRDKFLLDTKLSDRKKERKEEIKTFSTTLN